MRVTRVSVATHSHCDDDAKLDIWYSFSFIYRLIETFTLPYNCLPSRGCGTVPLRLPAVVTGVDYPLMSIVVVKHTNTESIYAAPLGYSTKYSTILYITIRGYS